MQGGRGLQEEDEYKDIEKKVTNEEKPMVSALEMADVERGAYDTTCGAFEGCARKRAS